MRLPAGPYCKHRPRRRADDVLGDATEKKMAHAGSAMRGHYNQVHVKLFGGLAYKFGRLSNPDYEFITYFVVEAFACELLQCKPAGFFGNRRARFQSLKWQKNHVQ